MQIYRWYASSQVVRTKFSMTELLNIIQITYGTRLWRRPAARPASSTGSRNWSLPPPPPHTHTSDGDDDDDDRLGAADDLNGPSRACNASGGDARGWVVSARAGALPQTPMGDEPAEVAPVQLTASFVLLERAEPPPKPETPADGAEDPAAAEGETPPAIESITFALTVDDPVGAAETSEPLSVTIPQASEEEPNPAPTDWPEAVKWAHTLEISVDEANSEVDFLRGGFHVAVKNGNDDLVAADIDLSEFLVNSKAVSRRFEIPDLGLVAVTVTLDKVWLPEALALQLMPMAVTVRSVEALPKDPHSYSALATAFEPVHCEYQLFDSQPTVKTEALPHGKKLNFKDRHVFHAGRFASAADVQALLEAGTY
eukprot:SAG31_NODE_2188_length_6235_cov_4.819100_1_plen_370_part_00